jgi:hypothetical protein
VIAIPTSHKFHTLKHKIPLAGKDTWNREINSTAVYPDAMDECVQANLEFVASLPADLRDFLTVSRASLLESWPLENLLDSD